MTQSRFAAPAPFRSSLSRATLITMAMFAGSALDATALAQGAADAAAAKAPDNASLLADFIHYTRIQNYDLALAMATELLGKNLPNADFVALVEVGGEVQRFEETVQRAMRVNQLEAVAASLAKAYDSGKLERARNPEQVAKNIAMLSGTDRGRRIGEERLVFAGEYAMPQLLEAFLDRSNPQRQAAVQRVIVGLGRHAVMPLCASMVVVPVVQQEQIADVLGMIPHRASLPFLRDGITSKAECLARLGAATSDEPQPPSLVVAHTSHATRQTPYP